MVQSITLHIPDEKIGVADWLMKQNPEVVAIVLELSQTVYNMNKMNVNVTQKVDVQHFLDCIAEWEDKYKKLLMKNQEDIVSIVDKTKRNCEYEYDKRLESFKRKNDELVQRIKEITEEKSVEYKRQIDEFKIVNQKYENEHRNEIARMEKMMDDLKVEKNKLQMNVSELTKLFTGSASNTGIVGENLVHYVFNTLQLGMLDDLRHDSSLGCEDYLWSHDEMLCSVEVKNSKCLHSKHDMEKHFKRLDEAVKTNKINCAMFLSLNARVPNMSALQLKMHLGIPVLYVSKCESLSHNTLIELSFRYMNIIWNMNKNSKKNNTDEGDILENVSNMIDMNMKHIEVLERSINVIEKNTQNTFIQLQKMKKSKENALLAVSQLHSQYPCLKFKDKLQYINSPMLNVLLKAIDVFHKKRMTYPKSVCDVKSYLEDPEMYEELFYEFDDEFSEIIQNIKKNPKKMVVTDCEVDDVLRQAILNFHKKRKKYPKKMRDIKIYLENPDEFDELNEKYQEGFSENVEKIKMLNKNSKKLQN